jgi:hypothetical protein
MKAIDFKKVYAQASPWALPLLGVLFIISLWNGCHKAELVGDLTGVVDSLQKKTVILTNEKGQAIAQNQQATVASGKQLQALTDSIFKLRKEDQRKTKTVEAYARIVQQYEAGGKFATFKEDFTDLVYEPDTPATARTPAPTRADSNTIRVPKPFMYWDSTITFTGRVTRTGVWLDSIHIDNTVHLRTVVQKKGFMGFGSVTSVQVLNSNPAITTTGVTSLVVSKAPKWWNRWGKLVAGAVLGGVAVHQITR